MNKMKKFIFTYGSLILDKSPVKVKPVKNCLLFGWKLVIQKSPITKTDYHYILLEKTNSKNDIVSGYISEVDDEILSKIDSYEGKFYKRIEVDVFDRRMNKCRVFVYVKNNF